ncbi:hypothetical protein B1H56_01580 [Christensenella minuta]|jgi:hypothetical protein|nr:hypothetical protein B1H56_01580 [Christensenella minuta]
MWKSIINSGARARERRRFELRRERTNSLILKAERRSGVLGPPPDVRKIEKKARKNPAGLPDFLPFWAGREGSGPRGVRESVKINRFCYEFASTAESVSFFFDGS